MKLYINAASSYRSDRENTVIKSELKERYKYDTRRQDLFIYLGLLGAFRLKERCDIAPDDELYLTSGLGNIDVIVNIYSYAMTEGSHIKPFDFINMLGNTASYYIAKALGVNGKTLFQISDQFTYINTLIMAYASMLSTGSDAIVASCDLATHPEEIIKRLIGVDESVKMVSSSSFQKLSLKHNHAIAEIEFDAKTYALDEVVEYIKAAEFDVLASIKCQSLDVAKTDVHFETISSSIMNDCIEKKKDLIFVDCCADKYKILKLRVFDE